MLGDLHAEKEILIETQDYNLNNKIKIMIIFNIYFLFLDLFVDHLLRLLHHFIIELTQKFFIVLLNFEHLVYLVLISLEIYFMTHQVLK